jgi:hypothetical protein
MHKNSRNAAGEQDERQSPHVTFVIILFLATMGLRVPIWVVFFALPAVLVAVPILVVVLGSSRLRSIGALAVVLVVIVVNLRIIHIIDTTLGRCVL